MPYYEVALAATLPALLYFIGLFLQVDAYAGARELKGIAKADLPGLAETLRQGWYYIGAFGLLIFLLLVLQNKHSRQACRQKKVEKQRCIFYALLNSPEKNCLIIVCQRKSTPICGTKSNTFYFTFSDLEAVLLLKCQYG